MGETTKDLEATKDVVHGQMIDVFLGQPNNHMLIFSGIAKPEFDDYNDDLKQELVIVHLDQTVDAILQSAATVGLARIHNTDSNFLFASDEAWVDRDDQGRIAIKCRVAVQGDYSLLSRFSYYATVIAAIDEPYVAGVIAWRPDEVGNHGPAPQLEVSIIPGVGMLGSSQLFEISAMRDIFPSSSDPTNPTFAQPTQIAFTHETPTFSEQDGLMQVPYTLRLGGVPNVVGRPFNLVGTVLSGAFPKTQKLHVLKLEQISGPQPIALTGSHLHEDGVNWRVVPVVIK